MAETTKGLKRTSWRRFRIIIVATLIALTIQGWIGDATNLFAMFPSGGVEQSLNGILNGIVTTGFFLVWHAFEGVEISLFLWSSSPFLSRPSPRASGSARFSD